MFLSNHYTTVSSQTGFSLLEMAVVLIIVGILIGGLTVPLSAQINLRNMNETKKTMDDIKESLLGFVVTSRRLPCPDTDNDGMENLTSPTIINNTPIAGQSTQTFSCTLQEGLLPFVSLGVGLNDAWSNHFQYRVTARFSSRTIVWSGLSATGSIVTDDFFKISDAGDITIKTRGDDPSTAGVTESKFLKNISTTTPVVVISLGQNGSGATTINGNVIAAPPASNVDELMNTTIGVTKMDRFHTQGHGDCDDTVEGTSSCEYDDIIDWISSSLIISRMVTTGQLP